MTALRGISLVCFLVIMAFQAGGYLCLYELGRLEKSWFEIFNPFVGMLVVPLSFLFLLGIWVASLFVRKSSCGQRA
jgi:hypothetical protein